MERPRVLLVDDMPEMIEYFRELLKTDYYDLIGAAPNAAMGLRMAQETKPHIVLLDISMPGMNGIGRARRLRASGCSAAIVFVSSHDALATEAMKAGGSAFISKNLITSDLRVAIREALTGQSFVSVWPQGKP